jgi:hypothetical protein
LIMNTLIRLLVLIVFTAPGLDLFPQPAAGYRLINLVSEITEVQPMTGIVFWTNSSDNTTDVISLEYSYMLFNQVVKDSGEYNWDAVEQKLDAAAGRNHQVIFRFRYVYPGYQTSVPDYIKSLPDYKETKGISEGRETWFSDWTHPELRRFTLEFYSKFAERYDNDPRLAFIQVGFGLWAEYHIYDGPFILGKTFPSKEFQEEFFRHLESVFISTPWSVSIDAASDDYSPFEQKPELKNIRFGLFDDSFMHEHHSTSPSEYNMASWNFFGTERYRTSPAGGEFSYYTDYDQQHVLDPEGSWGRSFEDFAGQYHISYILGNDQPSYQSMERIKEAGMACGYRFRIISWYASDDSSLVTVTNDGIAPIYYDAYICVNGIRAAQSLKGLCPGEAMTSYVPSGGDDPSLSIECDRLLDGQVIQFTGTGNTGMDKNPPEKEKNPGICIKDNCLFLEGAGGEASDWFLYDLAGRLIITGENASCLPVGLLEHSIYILLLRDKDRQFFKKVFI